jgi:hypothetical protein
MAPAFSGQSSPGSSTITKASTGVQRSPLRSDLLQHHLEVAMLAVIGNVVVGLLAAGLFTATIRLSK